MSKMRKFFILLCLFLIVVFNCGFSLTQWTDSVYEQIKNETIKGLKDSFKQDVKVGSVSGLIVGQVVFHDVTIPNFAQAKKIYVNYDLVKFFIHKNIVPAITKITIVDGNFTIIRDYGGQINAVNLLPPEEPGAPPPPPFRAHIVFKNCSADYTDYIGFKQPRSRFAEKISGINGRTSFNRKDRIDISLSGKIHESTQPTEVKISGSSNYATSKYSFKIQGKHVNASKWANYTVPLPGLSVSSGKADLVLRLASPTTKGWPVSLVGNFNFVNGNAIYGGYKLNNIYGKLTMADDQLAFDNISLKVNDIPLKIDGRFYNFSQQNLDLKLSTINAGLNKVIQLFPQTEKINLTGRGNAQISLTGRAADLKGTGTITINKGKLYNQEIRGQASLSLEKNILTLASINLAVFKGRLSGSGQIDFSKKVPRLSVKSSIDKIDLAALSQNSPGIIGQASGQAELAGPINNLEGDLSASLSDAMLFGQPLNNIVSSFSIKDGDIYFNNFSATSQNAALYSSGTIKRDLTFNFKTTAQGIRLSGKGIIGPMEAMVNNFEGNINWQLNQEFLRSPLKNLNATGKISLSQGRLGEQTFDFAQGKVNIGQGLIEIENLLVSNGTTVIEASGQTGLGHPTNLKIVGEKIKLEELKILNYILPKEAKDPEGSASLNIAITGELSKETRLISLDPLFDLNVSGEVVLNNVLFAEIPIKQAQLNLRWDKHRLYLPDSKIVTSQSDFVFDLSSIGDNKIKASGKGIIDLGELSQFTIKYGKIQGLVGTDFTLEGTLDDPTVSASFWLQDFRFNNVYFDRVEGKVSLKDKKLSITKPITLRKGIDQAELKGVANIAGLLSGQPEETYLDLDLEITKADLSSAFTTYTQLQTEISRRAQAATTSGKTTIDPQTMRLPTIKEFKKNGEINLYIKDGDANYFLKSWDKIRKDFEKTIAQTPQEKIGGQVTGKIKLLGKIKNLSGQIDGKIIKGNYRDFQFDSVKAEAMLGNQKLAIKKLELTKDNGKLVATGDINFDGTLALKVSAKRMPTDILRIVFNKDFDGSFNMTASLEGKTTNPDFSADFEGKNITLVGQHFDLLQLKANKKDDQVFIQKLSLRKGKKISSLKGSFDVKTDGRIDVSADLKDNSIGLLNLFTNEIRWLNGKAQARVTIKGSREAPAINGQISLEATQLYVKAIDSEIKNIRGSATITDGRMEIENLSGIWQGERTKGYRNDLSLSGTLEITSMFAQKPIVTLDINLVPTHIYANLTDLYSGEIKIESARLFGPYYFDHSAGPTLAAKAEITNCVITVGKKKKSAGKAAPLNLDINTKLDKNVYIVMGDVSTFDLSNIFMNLEVNSEELKITDTLATPSLLGKIYLKRGTVTIFNREFSLISSQQQENYYSVNAEKIKDNTAIFTGEKGKEGVMPKVELAAVVEVDNKVEDASGELVNQPVTIISQLEGVIGAEDKERGLKVSFDSFTSDTSSIKVAGYSDEEIKVMLLPDFIKSLTGVSRGQDVDVNGNVVVADYISSRLQTIVFRGVERDLEQRLGLESLTLEYNFGKDIRQAMGANEQKTFKEEKPDWRVGFAKGFFDKLYIDVKYSQVNEETGGVNASVNYQITYKLSPIWSIIYYREPISLQEISTGYQKITLKAGFSFW